MTYFNDYDERGERRSLLPSIPLSLAIELSLLTERDREAKWVSEMQRVIGLEDDTARRQETELQHDLAYLRELVEAGEQGFYSWRVKAAVEAARAAHPLGDRLGTQSSQE